MEKKEKDNRYFYFKKKLIKDTLNINKKNKEKNIIIIINQ